MSDPGPNKHWCSYEQAWRDVDHFIGPCDAQRATDELDQHAVDMVRPEGTREHALVLRGFQHGWDAGVAHCMRCQADAHQCPGCGAPVGHTPPVCKDCAKL